MRKEDEATGVFPEYTRNFPEYFHNMHSFWYQQLIKTECTTKAFNRRMIDACQNEVDSSVPPTSD